MIFALREIRITLESMPIAPANVPAIHIISVPAGMSAEVVDRYVSEFGHPPAAPLLEHEPAPSAIEPEVEARPSGIVQAFPKLVD
jgi:hypothetical protein